jgi:hypothetical protein
MTPRDYNIEAYNAVMQEDGSYANKYGHRFWFNEDGEYHNESGPAIILKDESLTKFWYLNGSKHSFIDWCLETGQSGEDHLTPELRDTVKCKLEELKEVHALTKKLLDIAVLNLENYKSENNIKGFQT